MCLWIRAALRLPMLVFVGFYVSHGIVIGHRSGDFPDGAFFAWFHYTISEPDNLVTVPVAWLADAVLGRVSMTSWLALYAAGAAGYLVLGFLVWRGRPFGRSGYRTTLGYLMFSTCAHILTLVIVVPGAVDAIHTGENAPAYPYTGVALVHAYEWLLLPWSLALPAVTGAVVALLNTGSVRTHLGMRSG